MLAQPREHVVVGRGPVAAVLIPEFDTNLTSQSGGPQSRCIIRDSQRAQPCTTAIIIRDRFREDDISLEVVSEVEPLQPGLYLALLRLGRVLVELR